MSSTTAQQDWTTALSGIYDLLLGIMLPGMDGIRLLRSIRAEGMSTPVIMLTAKATMPIQSRGSKKAPTITSPSRIKLN